MRCIWDGSATQSEQCGHVGDEGGGEGFDGAPEVAVYLGGAVAPVDGQADAGDGDDEEADGEEGDELETSGSC